MRFDLTGELVLARDTARSLLAAEHSSDAARASLGDATGISPLLCKQTADLGWSSLLVTPDHGGGSLTDQPLVDLSVIAAEVGRAIAPVPLLETSVAADTLSRSANPDSAGAHLPGLLDGSAVAGWCVDADAWLDGLPSALAVHIARDGTARLSGTSVAAAGPAATVLLVSSEQGSVVVPVAAPGVTLEPLQWLDPSIRHCTVRFDDVAVPPADVVATGPASLERQLQIAWVLQAAELTGVVDVAFAITLEWLDARISFGRPLSSYQALKHRCADMKTWLEAIHAVADGAAIAVDQAAPDAPVLARAAKAYAAPRALELIQDCTQMHGGIGVTWEHDLHLYLRRATTIAATYGSASALCRSVAGIELEGSA